MEVVGLAMVDRKVCGRAEYRKGYCKLVTTAVEMATMFSPVQKKQLEVYQIWTICRSELQTDDSFVFSKSMSKMRVCRSFLLCLG